jgi:hypothetical protein
MNILRAPYKAHKKTLYTLSVFIKSKLANFDQVYRKI